MNLVCYPHFAAGGLICNLLNNQPFSKITSPTLLGHGEHSLFVGDNWDVYDDYDVNTFNQKYITVNSNARSQELIWHGTHCHPKLIDPSLFNVILSITTNSFKSKLYRWIRVYNLRFAERWADLPISQKNDRMRATAKSYLQPFYQCHHPNAVNLEFSDVVEKTPRFTRLFKHLSKDCDLTKVDDWLRYNSFLTDFTKTQEYEYFMQAEYEVSTQQAYEFQ